MMQDTPPMYQNNTRDYHPPPPRGTNTKIPDGLSSTVPSTQVEIHVSCHNLRNKDAFSKSDPMVILFTEKKNSSRSWIEYDRSEVVKDNLNPVFIKPFKLSYHFEEHQKLKFEIYDSDSVCQELNKHDYLGHLVISLGSIVGEHCGKVTKTLLGCENVISSISFLVEELNDTKEMVSWGFKGRNLDKKDFLGKSDPFLVIYRHGIENNENMPIHQTEVIKSTLNPAWKRVNLSVASLCNGDKHRPIIVECFDWNSDGSRDFIGQCSFTFDDMQKNRHLKRELINPKKLKKKNYKNSGVLDLENIEIHMEPSFLDYITGGIDLCFHVAIDFTASNGDPMQTPSLHYLQSDTPNQYTHALMAVGKICEDYDTDKLIPAYGFGAKIRGRVYHDFHLNQMDNPDCDGVYGVVEAYKRFLPTAELYGPTNFTPIINRIAEIAKQQKVVNKYHILLMLTDGVITDMNDTKNAVIQASSFPVSIIIVGIGAAQFDAMDELDSDKGILVNEGLVAERDIVQFVPFRNFCGSFVSEDLAKEVLYEVPNQLLSYMKKHGIKPKINSLNNNNNDATMAPTFPSTNGHHS